MKNVELDKVQLYIYIKNYRHLIFYLNLLESINYKKATFITLHAPIYLYMKTNIKYRKLHCRGILIKLFKKNNRVNAQYVLEERDIQILKWDAKVAKRDNEYLISRYKQLIWEIQQKIKKRSIGMCWGGNWTEAFAFASAIKKKEGKVIFGEITNFPRSIYLDLKGTNYYSSIRDQYLNELKNDKIYKNDSYKNKLKNMKNINNKIPQSKAHIAEKLFFKLNYIQDIFLEREGRYKLLPTIRRKVSKKYYCTENNIDMNINDIKIKLASSKKKYKILIPLQFNYDTQVKIFSRFDNFFDFIKFILNIADTNIEMHFKIHPAELKIIKKLEYIFIKNISKRYKNVKLIEKIDFKNYDAVATINSTFGIDSLLNDKRVIVFGKSLYSGFDFVWNYNYGDNKSIRYILENYDKKIDINKFNLFAKILFDNFYFLNFYDSSLVKGIKNNSIEKVNELINTQCKSILENKSI